jgi:hypothetical protein
MSHEVFVKPFPQFNQTVSMSIKLLCLFILFVIPISLASAQNVVVNGDFDGPSPMNGTIAGWAVTGNVDAVDNQGFTSPNQAAAFSVGNDSQGDMLSQTLATTIGQTYALNFDSGVFGEPANGPLTLQIQVFGASMDTLVNDTIAPPENNNFDPATFSHYTYSFTADSASTTLKFTDGGLGNANADVMLDTVSVTTVPEPGGAALTMFGAISLGLIAWRRRPSNPAIGTAIS